MKKVLLGIIVTIFMIIGMSTSVQAQIDSTSEWKVVSACMHDSQDEHLYYTNSDSQPYTLTINIQENTISINDPEREREYVLTGPNYVQKGSNGAKFYFDGIDEKLVKCQIEVTLFTKQGNVYVIIRTVYPNLILYWAGTLIEEESKIQASINI